MKTIIILSDGETWNTIDHCSICVIPDSQFNDLCDGVITAGDLIPVTEIGLKEFSVPEQKD